MWGTFPKTFQKALRPYVKGQRVVDIGCGDCERADILLGMDPEAIVGVDKDPPCKTSILTIPEYFNKALEHVKQFKPTVAHVAWPANYMTPGLVDLIQLVPTVIYVGSNVDGTGCGSMDFWRYITTREVLLYRPDRSNTLIIYGSKVVTRKLAHEEWAGLQGWAPNSPVPDACRFDATPYP
jgi:hypothetical protein